MGVVRRELRHGGGAARNWVGKRFAPWTRFWSGTLVRPACRFTSQARLSLRLSGRLPVGLPMRLRDGRDAGRQNSFARFVERDDLRSERVALVCVSGLAPSSSWGLPSDEYPSAQVFFMRIAAVP